MLKQRSLFVPSGKLWGSPALMPDARKRWVWFLSSMAVMSPAAGPGHRPGAVGDFAQDGVEVRARADRTSARDSLQ